MAYRPRGGITLCQCPGEGCGGVIRTPTRHAYVRQSTKSLLYYGFGDTCVRAAPCSLPCAPWTCSILTCFKRFVVAQNVVSRRSWLAPASTDNCVSRAEERGGLPFLLAQPSLRQRHITVDLYRDLQSLSPSRAHCHARVHASVCVRARARACACVCTLRACMLRTYTELHHHSIL